MSSNCKLNLITSHMKNNKGINNTLIYDIYIYLFGIHVVVVDSAHHGITVNHNTKVFQKEIDVCVEASLASFAHQHQYTSSRRHVSVTK